MSWSWTKIGDCAELISGAAFKSNQFTVNSDDVPLVKGENVQQGFIDWGIAKRWPKPDMPSYERFLLAPNDIVVAMDRPWVPAGLKWAFIADSDPQALLVQRVARLRVGSSTSAKFLKYVIASKAFCDYVKNIMGGTNVPHISGDQIRAFAFRRPSLPLQEKIGDWLSAYDDLIENNRRRIVLLEQSARLLYREWFVHLRFPGHEHIKMVDGVPDGWAILAVSEVADLYRGISYSSDQLLEEGGKPFVNLKCMNRFGGFRVSGVKRFLGEHKSQHVVEAGDIVVAVTDMTRDAMIVAQAAIVPKIVGEDAVFSMDMVKLVPKPAFASHWFHALLRFSSFSFEVREKANGATVLHLRPKHIEEWRTPVPPPALRDEYAEYVSPMYALMDELELQNEKLRQARDLLLPRLMSGDLVV